MKPQELVSVEQARALIAANLPRMHPEVYDTMDALGLAVAEDIFSPLDIPAFDQSSMDGYAVYSQDLHNVLVVQGIIAAGHDQTEILQRNHAMRIFTGAPIPAGSDTVVMQEKVIVHPSGIEVTDPQIEKGTHIRLRGSELKKGELVLTKGTVISSRVVGLLGSLGMRVIRVYQRLSITIIATGNELQLPGNSLKKGQVYESNVFFLQAALKSFSKNPLTVLYVEDDLEKIREALEAAIDQSDLVILTGGVSVGDYDFVRQAADQLGVQCRFHKVKQKPGKPLYFGTSGNKIVFGLPGNPGSVVSCFYEYVLPAIRYQLHLPQEEPVAAILKNDFKKVKGLTQFLKAYVEDGEVEILEAQESYRLRSFATANCLVALDENRSEYEKGEAVTIRLLPK